MAPIPPFLSLSPLSPAEVSCSECSGRLFPSSFSCCSSSGLPALYQCRRKTTAVPSPTISPGHSTPCSDTQMALLPSEPSGCYLQQCWQRKGGFGRKQSQTSRKEDLHLGQRPRRGSFSSPDPVCVLWFQRWVINNDRRRANRRHNVWEKYCLKH